jgi:hypothetical protein
MSLLFLAGYIKLLHNLPTHFELIFLVNEAGFKDRNY